MCSLCGVLGAEDHWSDAAARPDAFGGRAPSRGQERRQRVALANRVLAHTGLKLSEWQGQYLLSNRTGRMMVVPNLIAMWQAAETLKGEPPDPLAADLIAALERG
jgi:hypothetical protein